MSSTLYDSEPTKDAKTTPSPLLGAWAFALAALLFILLPAAGKMRSPGGLSTEWFLCASGAIVLLVLNVWGLMVLRTERWPSRLGLYLSLAIVVFVSAMLVDFAQEQDHFDKWAHRGIYYAPLDLD